MFDDLIGHAVTAARLREAVREGSLAPAVLFEGPPAAGKLSAALELGRVLNCKVGAPPDCSCASCGSHRALQDPHVLLLGGRDFAAGIAAASAALRRSDTPASRELFARSVRTLTRRFDDLLWAGSEPRRRRLQSRVADLEERLERSRAAGAAAAAAELARAANLEAVSVNAVRAIETWTRVATPGVKVIIVEVRRWLPEPASNALLRTVEEPPRRTHFIFTAPSSQALIPTLLSRLARYRFGERSPADQRRVIAEVFGDPQAAAATVAGYLADQLTGREAAAASAGKPAAGKSAAGKSAVGADDLRRAAERFCAAVLAGGGPDDAGAVPVADRDEGFAFLHACSEHLRALLRSPERAAGVQRIERWYRFLDDAAWRVKTMNMSAEATIAAIARSMAAGGEPPMRRW